MSKRCAAAAANVLDQKAKARRARPGNEKKDLDWAGDNQLTSLNLSRRVRALARSGCRLFGVVEVEELLEHERVVWL
jgi:hypothetical protein